MMDTAKLKSRLEGKVQELQKPAADAALAPSGSAYMALNGDALGIIRENLKNQPLSLDLFDIVKSPSGGSTVFSVPGLALVTTLEIGVRVHNSRVEYLKNRFLLVTGTRTSRGMMLPGRSRNSSTDSLQALALLSPFLEPKSLKGQWAQDFPSKEMMLFGCCVP